MDRSSYRRGRDSHGAGSHWGHGADERTLALLWMGTIAMAVLVARLFQLQVIEFDRFQARAQSAQQSIVKLPSIRAPIQVMGASVQGEPQLFPLALTRTLYTPFVVPREVRNLDETATVLSLFLPDEEEEEIRTKLEPIDDPYVPFTQLMEEDVMEALKAFDLPGVYGRQTLARYYPEGVIASHVVGFVQHEAQSMRGQYGIEAAFDRLLNGEEGKEEAVRDAMGRVVPVAKRSVVEARQGLSVVLTIDRTLEYVTCQALAQAVKRHRAENGTAVIVEPATGAIRALCNYPDFDPNAYAEEEDLGVFNNLAVVDAYEPGSVFKVITMAAALDAEVVTPLTTYVDTGSRTFGPHTIKNAADKVYGQQSMVGVLKESINTGAVFAAERLGVERFREYVRAFGFGESTGIELKPESSGTIRSLANSSPIYMATASFGQGITATPIQLVQAVAAIANGGVLQPFTIIKEFRTQDGVSIPAARRNSRRVLSERAATLVAGMMVEVVRTGHAKKAQVPGYYIAGKTGTAQIAYVGQRGYSGKTNHTFVGFGPVERPTFVILTKLTDPQDAAFAESTAVPLAGELEAFLLKYDRTPPTQREGE